MTDSDGNEVKSAYKIHNNHNNHIDDHNDNNNNNNHNNSNYNISSIIHHEKSDTFETVPLWDEDDHKSNNNNNERAGEVSDVDNSDYNDEYNDEGKVISDFYLSALQHAMQMDKNESNNNHTKIPKIHFSGWRPKQKQQRKNVIGNIAQGWIGNNGTKMIAQATTQVGSVVKNVSQDYVGPYAQALNEQVLPHAYNGYNQLKSSVNDMANNDKIRSVNYSKIPNNVAGAVAGSVYYAVKSSVDYAQYATNKAKEKGYDQMAVNYGNYATQKAFEYSAPVMKNVKNAASVASDVTSNVATNTATVVSKAVKNYQKQYKYQRGRVGARMHKYEQYKRQKQQQQQQRQSRQSHSDRRSSLSPMSIPLPLPMRARNSHEFEPLLENNERFKHLREVEFERLFKKYENYGKMTQEQLTETFIKLENIRLDFLNSIVLSMKEYLYEINCVDFEKNVVIFNFDCLFDLFENNNKNGNLIPIYDAYSYYLNFLHQFVVSIDCQLKTYELFYLPFKMPIDSISWNEHKLSLLWEREYCEYRGRNSYNFSDRWNRFSHTISKAMNNYADDVKKIMTKDETIFKKRLKFEHALGEKMGDILDRIQIAIHSNR